MFDYINIIIYEYLTQIKLKEVLVIIEQIDFYLK
jgi:hypothetical protein